MQSDRGANSIQTDLSNCIAELRIESKDMTEVHMHDTIAHEAHLMDDVGVKGAVLARLGLGSPWISHVVLKELHEALGNDSSDG